MKIQNRTRRTLRGGFSLAELMVVIVIIGLLATLVVPNVVAKLFVANTKKAMADIVTIEQALEEFVIQNNGRYPDSLEVLVEKDENGFSMLKRNSVPSDPWGNEYGYDPPNGNEGARIYSLGDDGQPGGEGTAADIDNFTIREGTRN